MVSKLFETFMISYPIGYRNRVTSSYHKYRSYNCGYNTFFSFWQGDVFVLKLYLDDHGGIKDDTGLILSWEYIFVICWQISKTNNLFHHEIVSSSVNRSPIERYPDVLKPRCTNKFMLLMRKHLHSLTISECIVISRWNDINSRSWTACFGKWCWAPVIKWLFKDPVATFANEWPLPLPTACPWCTQSSVQDRMKYAHNINLCTSSNLTCSATKRDGAYIRIYTQRQLNDNCACKYFITWWCCIITNQSHDCL